MVVSENLCDIIRKIEWIRFIFYTLVYNYMYKLQFDFGYNRSLWELLPLSNLMFDKMVVKNLCKISPEKLSRLDSYFYTLVHV